jgi:peptidoglycan/LPS O-acetylase OafA/YrhL
MNQRMSIPAVVLVHETNLDFVRAFAVLLVVGAHLCLYFGDVHFGFFEFSLLGRLGVAIFFVHSGIVNLFSIERHVQRYGEHHLFRAFMTRRCLRIYPLAVFVVGAVYLTRIPVAHVGNWTATAGNHPSAEIIPTLLLIQNFMQFDQILEPLWSLPYEIQMYCFFPLVYLILRRFKSTKTLLFAWTLLAIVDHLVAPHLAKHGNLGKIVAIPDLLFFFLWFVAGFYAYKDMQSSKRRMPFWSLPALLVFLCLACTLSYDRDKFVFITLCFGVALPFVQGCKLARMNRICAWVAKYSYGIYLLHDPAIWLGFVRLRHTPLAVQVGVFLATTFGGSVLLYHVLEHPMILVGNRASTAMCRPKTHGNTQLAAVGL